MSARAPSTFNAEEAENLEDIEKQFAVKVVQHMSTYWGILEKVPGSKLRLTKFDDEIFEHFKQEFPDFDPAATINEDEMKSKQGKERWRKFISAYEKKVDDFNFGTMLRANPKFEYGEQETIFAVRMQFYAIEIMRNRLGLNDWIYEKAQKEKEQQGGQQKEAQKQEDKEEPKEMPKAIEQIDQGEELDKLIDAHKATDKETA